MEREESKSEINMIKPTSFYSNESDKIKLNWFFYEFSIAIYDEIRESLGKQLKKYKIDDDALAEFSVYMSKKMKNIILQKIRGRSEKTYFLYEMVESYFPNLNNRMVKKILDAIPKALDEQLSFCKKCPTNCISDEDGFCSMFDYGPY